MKNSLRSLALAAGIASATLLGVNLASADTTAPSNAGSPAKEHRHGCFEGKHHRGQHFFQKIAKELGLSDQQKTQSKALWEQHRAQAKPLVAEMRGQRRQLRQLVLSGSADEAAIRAQSAKVASLQADLAVQRAKGAQQFMALLTPQQQAKLKDLEAKRAERFDKRHGAGPEE